MAFTLRILSSFKKVSTVLTYWGKNFFPNIFFPNMSVHSSTYCPSLCSRAHDAEQNGLSGELPDDIAVQPERR